MLHMPVVLLRQHDDAEEFADSRPAGHDTHEDQSTRTLPEASPCIDGIMRRAEGEKTYDDICPWTGEVIGQAADASPGARWF